MEKLGQMELPDDSLQATASDSKVDEIPGSLAGRHASQYSMGVGASESKDGYEANGGDFVGDEFDGGYEGG